MSETPTPPSTPTSPNTPSVAAAPAVKDSGEYFNSSRLKIIGMITAATVAVGVLGGIAGVAFDPDPVDKDNVIQPGGDGTQLAPQGAGSMGNSAPHGRADAITRTLPGADATSTPSPVGSASPGSDDEGTEDSDAPVPSDDGADGADGKATIPATGVDVFVPDGWHVDFTDDNRVFQSDDQNNFSFAFSYVEGPSVAAGDVLTQNIESLLPGENYTQLQTSDVVTLDPFGSVVSLAGIEYEALWVDNQGSISVHGQIYVGIRQDGTVLGILLEHAPAEDFEAAFEDMVPILDNSYGRFAGLA